MKQALQIAIDYMNDRLEDHDCKYQRHPATEAERINILADIETVKEALAKQEGQSNFCPQCEALARELKAAKQEQGEPVAWMFQHEETGRIMFVEAQQLEWGFEKGNPRLKKIGPVYTAPQPAPQGEPMAYFNPQVKGGFYWAKPTKITAPVTVSVEPMPLYATPQQRKPLTDEQREDISIGWRGRNWTVGDIIDAVEAAHGIKE